MRKIFIFFFALLSLSVYSQSADKAAKLFSEGAYQEAQAVYAQLLKKSPKNQLYLYRYARCADELGQKDAAIEYFEKAGDKYALRNYYLGLLYADAYRFSEAVGCLEVYISTIETTHSNYQVADSVLNYSRKAEKMLQKTRDIAVIDSSVVPKKEFLKAYHLSKSSGALTASHTQDDMPVITYLTDRGDTKLISQADGKYHIYRQEKQFDLWVHKTLLPEPVNDTCNSVFPFLLSDGFTLYFASDREEGLGGLDIYYTLYDDENNSYLQPVNLGMPFNSSRNDYMFAIDETEGIGYFSTDRRTSADSVCVYKFKYEPEAKYLKAGIGQVNDTVIRRRAQMLDLNFQPIEQKTPVAETEQVIVRVAENEEQKREFCFVLNDTTVYYRFEDFKNSQARSLYRQYMSVKANQELLEKKRKEYSLTVDSIKRQSLAKDILKIEEQLLLTDSTALLNQIRELETAVGGK